MLPPGRCPSHPRRWRDERSARGPPHRPCSAGARLRSLATGGSATRAICDRWIRVLQFPWDRACSTNHWASRPFLLHRGAHRPAHGNPGRIEPIQAEHVDAEVVGRNPLAMEMVDVAGLAEVMPCGHRVEPVLDQRILAGEELEVRLVNFDHQRVLAATDRAIAGGQLRKIGLDLELHRATMTAATIGSCCAIRHGSMESVDRVRRPSTACARVAAGTRDTPPEPAE